MLYQLCNLEEKKFFHLIINSVNILLKQIQDYFLQNEH